VVPLATSSAGAETPSIKVSGILDDSPLYQFGGGAAPVRDVPVAVAWLSAKTSAHGLVVDVTQLARFDSSPIGARVSFYPRKRRPASPVASSSRSVATPSMP